MLDACWPTPMSVLNRCLGIGEGRASIGYSRWTSPSSCSLERFLANFTWLNSGTIVSAECPPMTFTSTPPLTLGETPSLSVKNVSARTTSRVVTPKRRLASKALRDFKISAAKGTRALRGLERIIKRAFGQILATRSIKGPTMPAVGTAQTFRLVNGAPEETNWRAKQGCLSLVPLSWGPTWWPSRDNDYVSSCKSLVEAIIARFVAFDYLAESCLTDETFDTRKLSSYLPVWLGCGRGQRPRRMPYCDHRARARPRKDLGEVGGWVPLLE